MSRLGEIRARERAATAKAWWWNSYSGIWCGSAKEGEETLHQIARINDIPNPEHDGDELQTEQGRSNAEFIAYAREDMSVLLAVAEAAVEWHNTKGYSNDAYLALAKLHNAVAVLEPDK